MTEKKTSSRKTDSRKTVGALSREAACKTQDTTDPVELARQNMKDYVDNLFGCVNTHKKMFDDQPGFYVCVITKQEPLMKNVFRNYFAGTRACPTPDFDQAIYRYDKQDDKIEFLWALPHEAACKSYRDHALQVIEEEKELLSDILDFYDGTLLRLAMTLNGETAATPKIELKVVENTGVEDV